MKKNLKKIILGTSLCLFSLTSLATPMPNELDPLYQETSTQEVVRKKRGPILTFLGSMALSLFVGTVVKQVDKQVNGGRASKAVEDEIGRQVAGTIKAGKDYVNFTNGAAQRAFDNGLRNR